MNNTRIDAPCKGCTERCIEPNCHGTCSRYLAWRERHQAVQEAIKAHRKTQNDMFFVKTGQR